MLTRVLLPPERTHSTTLDKSCVSALYFALSRNLISPATCRSAEVSSLNISKRGKSPTGRRGPTPGRSRAPKATEWSPAPRTARIVVSTVHALCSPSRRRRKPGKCDFTAMETNTSKVWCMPCPTTASGPWTRSSWSSHGPSRTTSTFPRGSGRCTRWTEAGRSPAWRSWSKVKLETPALIDR